MNSGVDRKGGRANGAPPSRNKRLVGFTQLDIVLIPNPNEYYPEHCISIFFLIIQKLGGGV